MTWFLPRALWLLAAMAAGAFIGWLIGALLDAPALAGALGAAVALVLAMALEALRSHRLMFWLRAGTQGSAPRDTGFWGELGYRIERALRGRDVQLEAERNKLAQFLSAIEASPNGVLLLDGNDQIDWCNSVAADHFGLDPVRDLRQRVTNLVRSPAFVAHLQSRAYDESVQVHSPGGRAKLSVLVRPYGDGLRLVLTQDITERERADAMRRDFVANVSHEIRTPLTVLSGFVETLTELQLSEAERHRALHLMAQQTTRMHALVADLLTLAQLEGSPRPALDQWLGAAALLHRVHADALALSAGRHTLHLVGGEDAEIAGNEHEMLSAVGNLVSNAIRYTPDGGHVTLRWSWRDTGGADISVVDSGVGIERQHLARLTERFYRVDSSRSRDTGGTGLGLAIVKHVAQRHGGEITVDSEVGRGSTFRLTLPAARVRRVAPANIDSAGALHAA